MNSDATPPTHYAILRRKALVLVWIGLLWNIAEAVVALWSGFGASSVALIAFGLKSIIELVAGGVLLWRLRAEFVAEGEGEAEQKAERIIGVTFLLLAASIVVDAGLVLMGWLPEPKPTLWGIAIAVSSVAVMSALYAGKMPIAMQLNSRSLRGEAIESLMCDVQDLTILVGLGLNALGGWWWADPVASLALVPFLIKEGREGLASHDEEEQEHHTARVCFCRSCLYGLVHCRGACCMA